MALALSLLVGCGGGGDSTSTGSKGIDVGGRPAIFGGGAAEQGASGAEDPASLGFPEVATKNTTRVGGSNPAADAAAVALAVFPSATPETRPRVVALADGGDWHAATVASALMAPPVRAPLLLSDGTKLPDATSTALDALKPSGTPQFAKKAQILSVGVKPEDAGGRRVALLTNNAKDPFALAAAVDRFLISVQPKPAPAVMVVGTDRAEFGVPAAALAAKSGTPVLFTERDRVPAATRAAIAAHGKPRIYVIGPATAVSAKVVTELGRLGPTVRVAGDDPVANAIAVARFRDGNFGWGVTDPGHGLVIADQSRPVDGPAGAALSSSGTYGPLLLTSGGRLPAALLSFLLDIQPGYRSDPTRGVYNHAWLVGDVKTIPLAVQSQIDGLLEIAPVTVPKKKP